VDDAEDERGNGDQEANERAGSADVEKGTGGANGRTDEDERAERADQRGERNEERIAGMNVVMATREKVAEFVSEQNREQG